MFATGCLLFECLGRLVCLARPYAAHLQPDRALRPILEQRLGDVKDDGGGRRHGGHDTGGARHLARPSQPFRRAFGDRAVLPILAADACDSGATAAQIVVGAPCSGVFQPSRRSLASASDQDVRRLAAGEVLSRPPIERRERAEVELGEDDGLVLGLGQQAGDGVGALPGIAARDHGSASGSSARTTPPWRNRRSSREDSPGAPSRQCGIATSAWAVVRRPRQLR